MMMMVMVMVMMMMIFDGWLGGGEGMVQGVNNFLETIWKKVAHKRSQK